MKQTILITLLFLLPLVASADDSGSCGDGLTYYYEEATHTLTISKTGEGTGKMYDFTSTDTPWDYNLYDISKIVIGDGVIYIGNGTFDIPDKSFTIVVESTTPPTLAERAFFYWHLLDVIVPNGCVGVYATADVWKKIDRIRDLNGDYNRHCGDGLTYDYDKSTHTLTVSKTANGTGEMNDYYDPDYGGFAPISPMPWDVEKVVFELGVTSIGGYIFSINKKITW